MTAIRALTLFLIASVNVTVTAQESEHGPGRNRERLDLSRRISQGAALAMPVLRGDNNRAPLAQRSGAVRADEGRAAERGAEGEQVAARHARSIAEAHSANQLAAMNGTVCGWCAERLAESRAEMGAINADRKTAALSKRSSETGEAVGLQGSGSTGAGRVGSGILQDGKRPGDYINRCRTAIGEWREEVMTPSSLRRLDNDCRPLYIEGQLTDIDRFDRLDVDPRITSRCAYRSYWPRELIERLTKLGNGPLLAVEFRSTIKSDGSKDGRWFDSVELACGDKWCEVFVPYAPCDASPFGFVPWFVLGVK